MRAQPRWGWNNHSDPNVQGSRVQQPWGFETQPRGWGPGTIGTTSLDNIRADNPRDRHVVRSNKNRGQPRRETAEINQRTGGREAF